MLSRWPVHPILIAWFPILSLYQINQSAHDLYNIVRPLQISLLAAAILWLIIGAATRDLRRSAQSATLLIALFFTLGFGNTLLGHTATYLSKFWVYDDYEFTTTQVAYVAVPLTLGLLYLIWKRSPNPRQLDGGLNLAGAVLVLLPVWNITARELTAKPTELYRPEPLFAASDVNTADRPDIYFILLDGYARADVLKELYDFDNSPFLDSLKERGFFVADQATSNYTQTMLSVPSILNADYIPDLKDYYTNREPLRQRIGRNAVARTLRSLGYRFAAFDSGYDATEIRFLVDEYLTDNLRITPFHQYLLDRTPISWFLEPMQIPTGYERARDRVNFILNGLERIAEDPQPTFTYAHFLLPHPPFIYKADGSPYETPDMTYFLVDGDAFHMEYGGDDVYQEGYPGQVAHLNTLILETVDAILARSETPPLIILQSDHGSGLHYSHVGLEHTDIHERFGTLSAIRWPNPDQRPANLTHDLTGVNLFRVLLGSLFDQNLPLLPAKHYYSVYEAPYDFVDVSEPYREAVLIRTSPNPKLQDHSIDPAANSLPDHEPASP